MRSIAFAAAVLIGAGITSVSAEVLRQTTDTKRSALGRWTHSIAADGSTVYQVTTGNPFGNNPDHSPQVEVRDAATGSGSPFLMIPEGFIAVSVTSDGTGVAFTSYGNPTGQNHDESAELFFSQSDGSGVVQLTSTPLPSGVTIEGITVSGSGNRVLFKADFDPLGTNAGRLMQLFVVDTDGSNLRQLTASGIEPFSPDISDDGNRIVYFSDEDPLATNADGRAEVFAIEADGTNLRQLTSSASYDSYLSRISGDGDTVIFLSREDFAGGNAGNVDQLFAIDWSGGAISQVLSDAEPKRGAISITDDGSTVAYLSAKVDATQNPGGLLYLWTAGIGGSSETALVDASSGYLDFPEISGDGSRIAFRHRFFSVPGGNNPDEERELYAIDTAGNPAVQLTTLPADSNGCSSTLLAEGPALTPDGTRMVFVCNQDIYRQQTDGSDLVKLTDDADVNLLPAAGVPDISGDGQTVVYHELDNGTIYNVYAVDADGSNRRRLNPDSTVQNIVYHPIISDDGSTVVFEACYGFSFPPTSGCELYSVAPDGSGLTQMTDSGVSQYKLARIDESGTWVTYQSEETGTRVAYRVRTDGTGQEAVSVGEGREPDIDAAGNRIVFDSRADPLGTNADGNSEIFLRDYTAGTLTQLTDTIEGNNLGARISRDGNVVFFDSSTPFFEANPQGIRDVYRLVIGSGDLRRVGGLRRGESTFVYTWEYRDFVQPDATGRRVLFGEEGDYSEENQDGGAEFWLADFGVDPAITVSKTAPTVFSWEPMPSAIRYDAIRGNVADLAASGGNIDLGSVVCLEDESPDADTEGFGDTEPPAGTVYFYLFRGTQGVDDGPGSYGTGSDGSERLATGGDCNP
ncbi:hypothetical protein ABI59_19780 [Acidobacteria bacterium Mor1]|nr:hypothetical protein ABI59_19780 [Acidobacteria bacterium Mor1]